LRKVTMDIADVLRENGFSVLEPMLYPDAVKFSQLKFQATYIVMAFDTIWATPFFYLGYRAKADGKALRLVRHRRGQGSTDPARGLGVPRVGVRGGFALRG